MKSIIPIFAFVLLLIVAPSALQSLQANSAPVAAATTAPVIPIELLKNFYAVDSARLRAQAELTQAQTDVRNAQTDWQQAVSAMQKVCGDNFTLYQDSVSADPQCRVKPVVPKSEAKPAEKK